MPNYGETGWGHVREGSWVVSAPRKSAGDDHRDSDKRVLNILLRPCRSLSVSPLKTQCSPSRTLLSAFHLSRSTCRKQVAGSDFHSLLPHLNRIKRGVTLFIECWALGRRRASMWLEWDGVWPCCSRGILTLFLEALAFGFWAWILVRPHAFVSSPNLMILVDSHDRLLSATCRVYDRCVAAIRLGVKDLTTAKCSPLWLTLTVWTWELGVAPSIRNYGYALLNYHAVVSDPMLVPQPGISWRGDCWNFDEI